MFLDKFGMNLCGVIYLFIYFCRAPLHWMPFFLIVFLMVESLNLTMATDACNSLDVALGSFVISRMSRRCIPEVILLG